MFETFGSGVAWIDFDNDGFVDLYLRQRRAGHRQRALPQQRNGTFTDVTHGGRHGRRTTADDATRPASPSATTTTTAGSTSTSPRSVPTRCYRNLGNGTFADVTAAAGVPAPPPSGAPAPGSSITTATATSISTSPTTSTSASTTTRTAARASRATACTAIPTIFDGQADRLFRNNGDGTFADVSKQAGIANPAGKGLGVAFCDFDRDGDIDIYVANDMVRNFLYRNNGDGTFQDIAYARRRRLRHQRQAAGGHGRRLRRLRRQRPPRALRHELLRGAEHALREPRRRACSRTSRSKAGLGSGFLPLGFGTKLVRHRQRRRPRHPRHQRPRHRQRQAVSAEAVLRTDGSALRERRRPVQGRLRPRAARRCRRRASAAAWPSPTSTTTATSTSRSRALGQQGRAAPQRRDRARATGSRFAPRARKSNRFGLGATLRDADARPASRSARSTTPPAT